MKERVSSRDLPQVGGCKVPQLLLSDPAEVKFCIDMFPDSGQMDANVRHVSIANINTVTHEGT